MTADEFTYVDAGRRPGSRELARYDVYRAGGGMQLGQVVQRSAHDWVALDPDSRDEARGRSRAGAASVLWSAR
jgi:hypothetical protein